jgi:hypothetical protein
MVSKTSISILLSLRLLPVLVALLAIQSRVLISEFYLLTPLHNHT